jgi:uncharacterized protein
MHRSIALLCLLSPLLAGCMDMDAFMFENITLDAYELPGNTIPTNRISEVTFQSDGHTLHGFFVRSNGQRPGLTILYNHGNAESIDYYWDRVMYLEPLGANIFIYDYRGYGRSHGTPSEAGLHADSEAALTYLLSRNEVRPDSIVMYGFSLGTVAAIHLSAEVFDPLLLIVEAPIASARALAQGSLNLPLPGRWLTTGGFDNAAKVRAINTPFFHLHGMEDAFVRYRDHGRIVYENAPNPKTQRLIDRADHGDVPEVMGLQPYRQLILQWINSVR